MANLGCPMDTVCPVWSQGTDPSALLQPFLGSSRQSPCPALSSLGVLLPQAACLRAILSQTCRQLPCHTSTQGSAGQGLNTAMRRCTQRPSGDCTGEDSSDTFTLRWALYPTFLTAHVLFTTDSSNKLWTRGVLSSTEKLYKHFCKSKHERLEFI